MALAALALYHESLASSPRPQSRARGASRRPTASPTRSSGRARRDHRSEKVGPADEQRRRGSSRRRRASPSRCLPWGLIADAHVLGTDDGAGPFRVDVSFFDPGTARMVRGRASIARRMHTLETHMVTTAHFMRRHLRRVQHDAADRAAEVGDVAPRASAERRASRGRPAPTARARSATSARSTGPPDVAAKCEKNWRRFSQKCSVLPRVDAGSTIEKLPCASGQRSDTRLDDVAADVTPTTRPS